jgi:hypothetical protein
MFNRDLFRDYGRADAAKRVEDRDRLRMAALESRRNEETRAIIEAQGEGCAFCVDGAKSDSTASQIDICRAVFGYLPIYMDIHNQRPAWCPGFSRNGDGVACETGNLKLETGETNENEHQEELPL